MIRIAAIISHPVQYYAPIFRELARVSDLHVFYAHEVTPDQQAAAGFGVAFEWDIDLFSGYSSSFLKNVATHSGADRFSGYDTPEIEDWIDRDRFDTLLVAGWYLKCHWQAILAAKRRRIPVLVRGDSHLDMPRASAKSIIKAAAFPVLLRAFDAALYVGERNRAYYEHFRYPKVRLFHSPHCIDTARFSTGATLGARAALRTRLGIGADENVVLFAGKLIDFKRPLDLVEAVSIVRARGLSAALLVAGAGPLEGELIARADVLDIPLYRLGFQNQTEMPAAYAAADILALPSTGRETWGLVCNEALACGTPIVVSDVVGCAPDLAADGAVGRVFAMGNVEALADAIAASIISRPSPEAIRRISDGHSISAAIAGIVAAADFVSSKSRRRYLTRRN